MSEPFSPANIAGLTARLYELRAEIAQLKREESNLTQILKEHCEKTGEVVEVEGIPPMRLVSRRSGRTYDAKALAEHEPKEFARLLELGCLTVQHTLAEEQVKSGNLAGIHRKYSWENHNLALIFDDRRTVR
jgi:glutamate-1-semialdehyde aminotransferase